MEQAVTLSQHDLDRIDRVLERLYRLQDLDDFIVTAMRELPLLVDAYRTGYNEVNYGERRMMSIVDSPDAQKLYDKKQFLFESSMMQNPLIEHHSRHLGGPKKISDFLTRDQWRATSIYNAFYSDKAVGGEFQIAVALPLDENILVAFAFNRHESDFSERHREVLARLIPHLTQAYRNARDHTRMKQRLSRSEEALNALGASWIELDADLGIVRISDRAVIDMARFFGKSSDADRLPPEVEAWIGASLDARQASSRRAAPLVKQKGLQRLSLRILSGARNGGFSLLCESFIDSVSSAPLRELGLTKRQAEVLYWLCQGKSNAEIAAILKISIRTVLFHISRIFAALGISNRTEAARLAVTKLTARG
ncbi:helix-turn-helix transcriptional regulator [Nitratireductor sp. XY-223]|uniref:helix-turn-helix transcriptional regulator n=1 Tax=Nitratireductor sp. XY-223 TaxID=2561926 RepID=UPI001981CCF2|nr:helix-turn-helix transcriptional regulator [Nitratireductor sp. XY-223]